MSGRTPQWSHPGLKFFLGRFFNYQFSSLDRFMAIRFVIFFLGGSCLSGKEYVSSELLHSSAWSSSQRSLTVLVTRRVCNGVASHMPGMGHLSFIFLSLSRGIGQFYLSSKRTTFGIQNFSLLSFSISLISTFTFLFLFFSLLCCSFPNF